MKGFDVLPYLMYYPHFRLLFIHLVFGVFNLHLMYLVCVTRPLDSVLHRRPLFSHSTRAVIYDHSGLGDAFGELVNFYGITQDIHLKLSEFETRIDLVLVKWTVLEEEYRLFEKFLEDLKSKLVDINLATKPISDKRKLSSIEYEDAKWKLAFEDINMTRAVRWVSLLTAERDALYTQVELPVDDFSRDNCTNLFKEYKGKIRNVYKVLEKLGNRGIYLFPYLGYELPVNPELFMINALKELYHLFLDLDVFYAVRYSSIYTDRQSPFFIHKSSSLLSDWNTVYGYEALRLKYIDVPNSYIGNAESLLQFRSWVDLHEYKVRISITQIDDKFNWIWRSFVGLIQRIDKKLMPEVQALYDKLLESRL